LRVAVGCEQKKKTRRQKQNVEMDILLARPLPQNWRKRERESTHQTQRLIVVAKYCKQEDKVNMK
jgi:hypothetical protein